VGRNGWLTSTPVYSKNRDTASSSTIPISAEEAFFRRKNARVRSEDEPEYGVDETGTDLPSSDLSNALHRYVSAFMAHPNIKRKHLQYRSMDMTALLAMSILIDEAVKDGVGSGEGYLAFLEGNEEDGKSDGGVWWNGKAWVRSVLEPGTLREMKSKRKSKRSHGEDEDRGTRSEESEKETDDSENGHSTSYSDETDEEDFTRDNPPAPQVFSSKARMAPQPQNDPNRSRPRREQDDPDGEEMNETENASTGPDSDEEEHGSNVNNDINEGFVSEQPQRPLFSSKLSIAGNVQNERGSTSIRKSTKQQKAVENVERKPNTTTRHSTTLGVKMRKGKKTMALSAEFINDSDEEELSSGAPASSSPLTKDKRFDDDPIPESLVVQEASINNRPLIRDSSSEESDVYNDSEPDDDDSDTRNKRREQQPLFSSLPNRTLRTRSRSRSIIPLSGEIFEDSDVEEDGIQDSTQAGNRIPLDARESINTASESSGSEDESIASDQSALANMSSDEDGDVDEMDME
jgi:hypothetical protein